MVRIRDGVPPEAYNGSKSVGAALSIFQTINPNQNFKPKVVALFSTERTNDFDSPSEAQLDTRYTGRCDA